MSTELQKQNESKLKTLINSEIMKDQFAKAMPDHMDADRFCRIALTALSRTPKLMQCTQVSLMKCLMDLSAAGLEPDNRRAYLIPYKDECTLIISYQGLIDIVRRDPDVIDIQCFKIRANDNAEWINGEMKHSFSPLNDRGEVVATYTKITWKNGHVSIGEPFTKEDAEKARKSSKSGNSGPWKEHYEEMWRKSNIRRDAKMWPMSPEIHDRIQRDDQYNMRNITPTPNPIQQLEAPTIVEEPPAEEEPPPPQEQPQSVDPEFENM